MRIHFRGILNLKSVDPLSIPLSGGVGTLQLSGSGEVAATVQGTVGGTPESAVAVGEVGLNAGRKLRLRLGQVAGMRPGWKMICGRGIYF